MTTPSGTIRLSDVNVELGFASNATINMGASAVRTLGERPSGSIGLGNLRGKSNRVTANLTISANTANYNIFNNRGGSYNAGKTDIVLTINSGVVVYSGSTGSYALDTGTGWTAGDTITVVNNGTILGRGGNGGGGGGAGVGYANSGGAGGSGGPAFRAQYSVSVNNLNRIAGGGGGGGGGGGATTVDNESGEWFPASGGSGGSGIGSGSLTSASGGSGGGNNSGRSIGGNGGSGGTYGASGASGGSSYGGYSRSGGGGGSGGAAVTGNSNITWINTGTRNGAIT
jgi:hypothetical protein